MSHDTPHADAATVERSDAEWRSMLTPEQYAVLREHATERPGTSRLNHEHRDGVYLCAGCGTELFQSDTKFDAHCGWPSFHTSLGDAVDRTVDRSHGMVRTEVHCSRCGGHLGHVFEDGPRPTGERYCINGISLKFEPNGEVKAL